MIPRSTFALCSRTIFSISPSFFFLTGTVFCRTLLLQIIFNFFQLWVTCYRSSLDPDSNDWTGGFFCFLCTLFNTASSAAPDIPLCGLLRLRHWHSDGLTLRLDLIHNSVKSRIIALNDDLFPALGHWELVLISIMFQPWVTGNLF